MHLRRAAPRSGANPWAVAVTASPKPTALLHHRHDPQLTPLFTRPATADIILEALTRRQEVNRWCSYGYVILDAHY